MAHARRVRPLFPSPTVSPCPSLSVHCVLVLLCPRPIVSPFNCVPVPLCLRPIVSPSHCVSIPLCPRPIVPHPIMSPSHCRLGSELVLGTRAHSDWGTIGRGHNRTGAQTDPGHNRTWTQRTARDEHVDTAGLGNTCYSKRGVFVHANKTGFLGV